MIATQKEKVQSPNSSCKIRFCIRRKNKQIDLIKKPYTIVLLSN